MSVGLANRKHHGFFTSLDYSKVGPLRIEIRLAVSEENLKMYMRIVSLDMSLH